VRAVSYLTGQNSALRGQGWVSTYYSQTSCIGDSGGEFSVADPVGMLGRLRAEAGKLTIASLLELLGLG
jgi:hypothetical protein